MLSSSSSIRLYQLGLSSLEDLLLADRSGVANNLGALQHSDVYTSSLRNSTHLQIVNEGGLADIQ